MLRSALIGALLGLALAGKAKAQPMQGSSIAQAISDSGVDENTADWLLAKAWIETRLNPYKINRGDGPAGKKAAQRLKSEGRLPDCRPDHEYAFTGGAWQIMPAIFLVVAYPEDEQMLCASPTIVLDPRESLAMVLAYAGRLQKWASYRADPTWETLWLGFQSPSFMANRSSTRAQKSLSNMRKGLAHVGRSDLADKTPPTFKACGEFWRERILGASA